MKILWAVNPYKDQRQVQETALDTIRAIIKNIPAVIEPVYLLNSYLYDAPLEMPPCTIAEARIEAQGVFKEKLDGNSIPGLKELNLVPGNYFSLHLSIQELVRYAKLSQADLILVGIPEDRTHVGCFGDFTEELLTHSIIPVVVVHGGDQKRFPFK